MMSFQDRSIAYVTIQEKKIYNDNGNTWFIDDNDNFENGLNTLTSQFARMLDAGYEVTGTTFQSTVNIHRNADSDEDSDNEDSDEDSDEDSANEDSDEDSDETVVIKININLQRSAYAQQLLADIRAEQKRRAEEQRRLQMEIEERNRQEQVVSKAQNIFSPNYNRELKYTNLQKGGTRSRRKRTQPKHRKHRTQRKHRKTKNKKRS